MKRYRVIFTTTAKADIAGSFELGRKYWDELAVWARARRLLSDEQSRLLTVVSRLPGKVPTDWQSEKLLQLKAKSEEEGFPSR